MIKQSIKKILIVLVALIMCISFAMNVKFLWDRSNGYIGVRCVDCHKKTNYLIENGQAIAPSEDTYLIGETVEELIPQLEYAFPWMCENCVYKTAQDFLGIHE